MCKVWPLSFTPSGSKDDREDGCRSGMESKFHLSLEDPMLAEEQSETTARLIPTLRQECKECSTVLPNLTLALPRVMTHEAAPGTLQSGTPETLGVQSLPVTLREATQEILAPTTTSTAVATSEKSKVTEVKVPTATTDPKSIPLMATEASWVLPVDVATTPNAEVANSSRPNSRSNRRYPLQWHGFRRNRLCSLATVIWLMGAAHSSLLEGVQSLPTIPKPFVPLTVQCLPYQTITTDSLKVTSTGGMKQSLSAAADFNDLAGVKTIDLSAKVSTTKLALRFEREVKLVSEVNQSADQPTFSAPMETTGTTPPMTRQGSLRLCEEDGLKSVAKSPITTFSTHHASPTLETRMTIQLNQGPHRRDEVVLETNHTTKPAPSCSNRESLIISKLPSA